MTRLALLLAVVGAIAAQPAAAAVKAARIHLHASAYDVSVRYPVAGNKPVDAAVAQWARDYANDFARSAVRAKPPASMPWNVEVSYRVPRNDREMFEVLYTLYSFTGGPHPDTAVESHAYLASDGYEVDLVDIVGRRGIARVSELAIANLLREIGPDSGDPTTNEEEIRDGAGPKDSNFDNFIVTRTSLILYFNPMMVSGGGDPVETTIPLARLKAVIRPDWRVAVPSFDCTKAATAVEKAICRDGKLARLDRQVARDYEYDLTFARGAERPEAAVKAAQHAFIVKRDRDCGALPPAKIGQCIASAYKARRAAIQKDMQ